MSGAAGYVVGPTEDALLRAKGYTPIDILGGGSFGTVVRCLDPDSTCRAVKVTLSLLA